MSNIVYIVTELEDIKDVCSSEESAKKAVNYWVDQLKGNWSDINEARENISYESYEMDRFSLDLDRDKIICSEYEMDNQSYRTREEKDSMVLKKMKDLLSRDKRLSYNSVGVRSRISNSVVGVFVDFGDEVKEYDIVFYQRETLQGDYEVQSIKIIK